MEGGKSMRWSEQQRCIATQLSPEVALFVSEALAGLERENVFDAPGVISGVLRRMRMADSELIQNAVARTEGLLKETFAPRTRRLGA